MRTKRDPRPKTKNNSQLFSFWTIFFLFKMPKQLFVLVAENDILSNNNIVVFIFQSLVAYYTRVYRVESIYHNSSVYV